MRFTEGDRVEINVLGGGMFGTVIDVEWSRVRVLLDAPDNTNRTVVVVEPHLLRRLGNLRVLENKQDDREVVIMPGHSASTDK